jgi:hypothetical protein
VDSAGFRTLTIHGVTLNSEGASRNEAYYKERAITRYPFLNGSNGSITKLGGGNGATEYENLYFRQYLAQWEGVPVPTAFYTNIIDDGREFWMAPNDGSTYNGEKRESGAGHFKKKIVEGS